MIKQRFSRLIIYSIVFVFTFLLCKSIYTKIGEMNGVLGYKKLSLSLKDSLNKEKGFTLNEANELERILQIESSLYCSFEKEEAASDLSSNEALICGIKGPIEQFYDIQLKKGTFFDDKENESENAVVVIDEKMAKMLFNSEDVVGLKIVLYNMNFTIIGVADTFDSIAEESVEKRLPLIYIPLEVMNSVKIAYITNIQISDKYNLLDKVLLENGISAIGKDSDYFCIEDFKDIGKSLGQKLSIIIFLLGAGCIFVLLREAFEILRGLAYRLKKDNKEYYIEKWLDLNKKYIFNVTISITLIMISAFFIWKNITFDLYLQPQKIPNDPTSLSQYFKILDESIRDFWKFHNTSTLPRFRTLIFLYVLNEAAFSICILSEILLIVGLYKNIKSIGIYKMD